MDCVFCEIIKGEIPSFKIYEDENVFAFLDVAKDVEGHTLVVSKKHFVNVLDVPADVLAAVVSAVKKISNHYVDCCGFSGVNILNSSGVDAEQKVLHLHFHVIPRKDDDGLNVCPVFEKTDMDLEKIWKRVKMV